MWHGVAVYCSCVVSWKYTERLYGAYGSIIVVINWLSILPRNRYPVAVCCGVLCCVTVCCGVLRCVAVCCSVLRCVALCCIVLQCVAVCCSVLQCVATSF